MYFAGIDPGKTGGYALIDSNGQLIFADRFTNWKRIKADFIMQGLTVACIEKIAAMPFDKKRLKSFATLMANYGGWLSLLESNTISHQLVSPQKWHTKMLGHFPRGESKKRSMEFVQRKYPYLRLRASDHGITDAVCLALYALIIYKRGGV